MEQWLQKEMTTPDRYTPARKQGEDEFARHDRECFKGYKMQGVRPLLDKMIFCTPSKYEEMYEGQEENG